MIGNKYLKNLYDYPDIDTSINQLMELLICDDTAFINSLETPMDLDALNNSERHFMTIIAAVIDYRLQLDGRPVPRWLRADALCFDVPYFHSKRLSDFEKVKIQYTVPAPFRARQVYLDPAGLIRV
ncbi:hypothetical protein [Acetobacterium wieringae]|uniref:hypothetical protein n=1 Tax=Acetobacterium wieringae TaxID=52694 RepID=UPI0031593AA0